MQEEIFKDIIGYEGLYQVSNLGNVKSLSYKRSGKERILKPRDTGEGYVSVDLKGNQFKVHRLVALSFIPNPENKLQVNHIDGNHSNNNVENLEWCTQSENQLHSFRILGNIPARKGKFGKNNPTSKSVIQYDLQGNFIKKWDSMSEAERDKGFITQCISYCCKGKRKTSGGYIWKYNII